MGTVQRRTLAALIAAAAALLAACSAPPPSAQSSGDRVIAVAQPTEKVEDALARGTLEWGDGGCLKLNNGGVTHLVVFPHGTRLDKNDEVVLPDGFRLNAGDDAALGGGLHPVDMDKTELASLPEECLTENIWWASGDHVTEPSAQVD